MAPYSSLHTIHKKTAVLALSVTRVTASSDTRQEANMDQS